VDVYLTIIWLIKRNENVKKCSSSIYRMNEKYYLEVEKLVGNWDFHVTIVISKAVNIVASMSI